MCLQVRSGLTEAVAREHTVKLHFTDVGKLPPPVLQFINVTFGYSPDRVLYENVRPLSGSFSLTEGSMHWARQAFAA